jgi:putative flippase GtrA
MKNKVVELLQRPGIRYIIIGGSVYVLELVIITVAMMLGASAVLAVAISFILGLGVSFGLQKIVTFGDKRMHHKIVVPQLVAYTLLVIFNFSFTIGMVALLQHLLPPAVIRTIALGLTTIWNFYLYRTRIFHDSSAAE